MSARLSVLLTRDARRAVILRRGPSRRVLVVAWDTVTDRFEEGQWFSGRIYEDRCDLSPNGRLLVYFAAKHGRGAGAFDTWTAVSRPPYLTALALWPNDGTYGGGGFFESDHALSLATPRADQPLPSPYVPPPKGFAITRGPSVMHIREARWRAGGWEVSEDGRGTQSSPRTYAKGQPGGRFTLKMTLGGRRAPGGPFEVITYDLVDPKLRGAVALARTEWADWDCRGDLLLAREGVVLRVRAGEIVVADAVLAAARVLADLRDVPFAARAAPLELTRW